jgi:hypothetical protein
MGRVRRKLEPESQGVVRSGGRVRRSVDPGGVAAAVLGLQQTAGNEAVSTLLGGAAVQRQQSAAAARPAPAPAKKKQKPAAGGGTVGKVGGSRPAVQEVTKDFDNCKAAVDWLDSGGWPGDAEPFYKREAGDIRTEKLGDGTVKAEVDVSWSYDEDASTAEITVPTWPKMTKADRAAVGSYKAALKAHEVMHFDVTDKILKALPKTVSATGSTGREAVDNLKKAVETYDSNAHAAIDKQTQDYDTKTDHGRKQSEVGGVNVRLDCPKPEAEPKQKAKPKPPSKAKHSSLGAEVGAPERPVAEAEG